MEGDICRVCRSEGTQERPLFHPCVCTGSIKHIHQECLVLWLSHSGKEYCELCKHRFSFQPIYSPDMPSRLPIRDVIIGLLKTVKVGLKFWLHYTLVAIAWLGVVPLTAWRVYKCLFHDGLSSLLSVRLLLSPENVLTDCVKGCFVVACTLCTFISLVWLREQIIQGGGPEWLAPLQPLLPDVHMNGRQEGQGNEEEEREEDEGDDGNDDEESNDDEDDDGDARDDEDVEERNANGEENDVDAEESDNEDEEEQAALGDEARNWNPIDWDRAADELTWERMLGLDGSLAFLEHVFWVISLNTMFVLVFAFLPHNIGCLVVHTFPSLKRLFEVSQFEGFLSTLTGYLVLASLLSMGYIIVSLFNAPRMQRWLGLFYTVVKVSLLMMVEVGIFPVVCGWWIDICSLDLFSFTLKDRLEAFAVAPGTTMFIHWLVGMVYVFYFASFVLLIREIIRPGVLWFLRNLNDPDFHPIQEMIQQPAYRHARRFLLSSIIFGSAILVIIWFPVRVMLLLLPSFLPYRVQLSRQSPMSELSLELILLQVILPAVLEQGHTRGFVKAVTRQWAISVASLLNLHSYLLGKKSPQLTENAASVQQPEPANNQPAANELPPNEQQENEVEHNNNNNNNNNNNDNNEVQPVQQVAQVLGAVGDDAQAHLAARNPHAQPFVAFEPYEKPSNFHIRVMCLVVLMVLTIISVSVFILTVPVMTGRWLLEMCLGPGVVHEMYTGAVGIYVMWVATRIASAFSSWFPQGGHVVRENILRWIFKALRFLIAFLFLGIIIPLLLGLVFELVFIIPLRVPFDQSPVYFLWQDWAMGVLHTKIFCAGVLLGPNGRLKRAIEQMCHDGVQNIRLDLVIRHVAVPIISCLLLLLCVPYIIAVGLIPMIGVSDYVQNVIYRRIYPYMVVLFVFLVVVTFQFRQVGQLFRYIRNDKYLVGRQLVNYEPQTNTTNS
ncbi:E3 ubiquitin-protein ligase MARCHF6-like isoform X2 [Corticium candelabrum]|uniref:E3 ubiquitin-protein ligase MARCHF6-like isoform X2 n=1 Tax=Corticium candelabrum TaxID=121492 RepID=UPI002E272D31|nr:E3 ubiquitin-protein ligase MARCHF6-like isoform X2 [Corticium candelabrum]